MIRNRTTLEIDTGNFIKRCRVSKSMTGQQLGEILNVSQQQISRYERGETSINIETLGRILSILDKDWSDFFLSVLVASTPSAEANYSANLKLQKIN